jgi:Type II secretion system (T2SS), protein M subtype b
MTVHELWNRMLAVGLAVVPLCVLIGASIVWLYNAHVVLAAETAQAQMRLSAYEAMAGRRTELEIAVERSAHANGKYFWAASAETDGEDGLEEQLRGLIGSAGGRLQGLDPLPPTREGDYPAINFRVTLDASATELLETLYALESNRPYLFLDHLHIRVLPRTNPRSDAVLHATFDVRGYLDR